MKTAEWTAKAFEEVVSGRGSGAGGLPQKQWADAGRFPVIGQGEGDVEGWTDREDLLLKPDPAVVLYGGHTRRAKHVAEPFVPGPNVRILTPTPDLDSRFLFYFLTYLPVPSKGYADHFPLVRKCKVPYPVDLSEQRRIVAILDEAFEGIAAAKANVERNLRNARDVFQAYLNRKFQYKGADWKTSTLGETYDVRDGTHDSPKYTSVGYPLVTSKNLQEDGLTLDGAKLISEADFNQINKRSAVHAGDVLFAMIGTIGNPTVVDTEPSFAIKNVALFKTPKHHSGAFLRYYLSTDWVKQKMAFEAKGTTQRFVGLGYLRAFPISVPPMAIQLQIVESLETLKEKVAGVGCALTAKLGALDELKASLLHQAFTGQL